MYLARYQGESARTGYTRVGQHFATYSRDTAKARNESWMWEHTQEYHQGVRGPNEGAQDYSPKLEGTFRDPMSRQAEEGIRVKDDQADPEVVSLNTDNVYFKPEYLKYVWSRV